MTENGGPTRKDGLSPEAHAAYMREYRKTAAGKASLASQRKRQKARQRAVARLIAKHFHEFERLFTDELRKERLVDSDGS